jgi:hypothetical protein
MVKAALAVRNSEILKHAGSLGTGKALVERSKRQAARIAPRFVA